MRAQAIEPRLELIAQLLAARRELLVVHHVDHGVRGGHGHGVARVGAAQAAGGRGVHDLGAAGHGRQRHARGQRFGDGHEVGQHSGLLEKMFHREQLAGAAEAGLHLVGDEHDAVLVAQCAQPLHRLGLNDVEATLALDGLEDDGGYAGGFDVGLEQQFHRLFRLVEAGAMTGKRRVIDLRRKGAEARLIRLHFAGERHGKQAAAVEGAAKGNHPWALGVGAGNLDGVFHGFSAGGEQRGFLRVAAGREGVELFGQADIALIRHDLIASVGEVLQLLLQRGDDFRVAMADVHHRDAASEVDVAAAFDVPQLGALGAVGVEAGHHAHAAGRGSGAARLELFIQ